MNFFATGWQELERKIQRSADRARLWLEQRKLAAAEIRLGELGWMQADFPPEVEAQIQAITHVEHQQANFSNQSAEIQFQIEEMESRREEKRREHAAVIAAIESELQPLMQEREEARGPLASLQDGVGRFEQAIAGVREIKAELEAQLMEFQGAGPDAIEARNRIKDKHAECDFQIEDMQRAEMKLHNEIKVHTSKVAAVDLQIQDVNLKISDKWDAFNSADRELLAEIAALRQGKKETGRMVNRLDKQKSSAYLAVGQCLADYDIAPMNQPEVLHDVHGKREIVRARRERIEESLAASAQTNRGAVMAFYIVIAVAIFALVLAASLRRGPRHTLRDGPVRRLYADFLFPVTRATHSPMTATCAATRWSRPNSEGVSMVNVRLE